MCEETTQEHDSYYSGPVIVWSPDRKMELDGEFFCAALMTGAFPDPERPGTKRWRERVFHNSHKLDKYPLNLTAKQAGEFGRELERYLPHIPEPFTGEVLDHICRLEEDREWHDYVVVKGVGWVEVNMTWLPFQDHPEVRQELLDLIALLKSGPVRLSVPGVRYPEGEVRKFKRRRKVGS